MTFLFRLGILFFWLAFLQAFLALDASADELRSSGYVPISKAEFEAFPRAEHYRAFLPVSVDLSSHFPTPGDQGRLGACLAWSVGYAARGYYAQAIEGRRANSNKDTPSPWFIYDAVPNPTKCDNGLKFPETLQLLEKGSLSLADYPSSLSCQQYNPHETPPASDFKISGFLAVDPKKIDDVKGAVARGQPVMFGIFIDKKFEELRGQNVYSSVGERVGGHAMTVVGYDDARQAVKVINSWGTSWGDHGFGWISYDSFTSLTAEAYVMLVPPPAPKPEPSPDVKVVVKPPLEPKPEPKPKVIEPPPAPVVKPVVVAPAVPPTIIEKPVVADDCSQVKTYKEGTETVTSGFVATEAALAQIHREHTQPNDKIDVQLRPWPQCEVLMTLEAALKSKDRPKLETKSGQSTFKQGDTLSLKVTAPKKPAYVYISYVQADGTVVHLQQPPANSLMPSLSSKEYFFGDGVDGRPKFNVSPPYGREMVVVVSSASPLFDTELPTKQTEREYLSALRKAIIFKADPKKQDREISAAFLGVETQEK